MIIDVFLLVSNKLADFMIWAVRTTLEISASIAAIAISGTNKIIEIIIGD